MPSFGSDRTVVFTPTVQNAAYSAGNVMGGLQTINPFRDFTVPFGIFDNFMIVSKSGNLIAMTVYIFDTNPTLSTFTDKNALSLNSGDVDKLAFNPFIITPSVPQGATASMGEYPAIRSMANNDSPPTNKLYIAIVANGTVTPGSTTDLVCKIAISQD